MQQQFQGVFQNVNFPVYEHREYPKWVNPKGTEGTKARVLVNSSEEEEQVAGKVTETSFEGLKDQSDELAAAKRRIAELEAATSGRAVSALPPAAGSGAPRQSGNAGVMTGRTGPVKAPGVKAETDPNAKVPSDEDHED